MLTPETLQHAMPPLARDKVVWVAYSGGCDSHVLLHLLSQLRKSVPFELKAVYVDHGLSPNAAQWGEHCRVVCAELAVEILTLNVDATPQDGASPEAAARQARYAAIKTLLKSGDTLCTAHHQEDQAETLLLQLLRGAGPKGLAGMPPSSPLGLATQVRPLLGFSQTQLRDYAEQYGLQWIEDESNSDTGFNRNYLRHEILPRLRERWPASDATIARSAAHCAEAARLMEVLAEQDFQSVKSVSSTELEIEALLRLENARQKNLLRYWIHQAGLPLPSEIKLQHILSDVLTAAEDKMPLVAWPGAEVRRYDGRLYVMAPLPEFDTTQVIEWADLSRPLELPDGSRLCCESSDQRPALDLKRLRQGRVTVQFRQGGERCRLVGSQYHKSLKQVFQERAVPPWRRSRIPLLYVDDMLVAVVGVCVTDVLFTTEFAHGSVVRLS
jgi:tRNA(Ile)-lysidine synthase